jgi:hypothetical protein
MSARWRRRWVGAIGEVVASTGTDTVGLGYGEIGVFAGMTAARAALQGPFLVRDRRPDTCLALRGDIPTAVDG